MIKFLSNIYCKVQHNYVRRNMYTRDEYLVLLAILMPILIALRHTRIGFYVLFAGIYLLNVIYFVIYVKYGRNYIKKSDVDWLGNVELILCLDFLYEMSRRFHPELSLVLIVLALTIEVINIYTITGIIIPDFIHKEEHFAKLLNVLACAFVDIRIYSSLKYVLSAKEGKYLFIMVIIDAIMLLHGLIFNFDGLWYKCKYDDKPKRFGWKDYYYEKFDDTPDWEKYEDLFRRDREQSAREAYEYSYKYANRSSNNKKYNENSYNYGNSTYKNGGYKKSNTSSESKQENTHNTNWDNAKDTSYDNSSRLNNDYYSIFINCKTKNNAKAKYRQYVKKYHPDGYINSTPAEAEQAKKTMQEINIAYHKAILNLV